MPFQRVQQTLQCDIRYIAQGQEVQNSLYFRYSEGIPPGSIAVIGSIVVAAWTAHGRPVSPPQVGLVGCHITDLDSEMGFSQDIIYPQVIPGQVNSQPCPNNVTIAISFGTSYRGRSAKGRNYIPLLAQNYVENNRVSTVPLEGWTAFYQQIQSETLDMGLDMCVVSRYHNKVKRETGETYSIVSIGFRDNIVDNQRRRLPGRGS